MYVPTNNTTTEVDVVTATSPGGISVVGAMTTAEGPPMDIEALARWFTAVGVLFALVVILWILNVILFHKDKLAKYFKNNFGEFVPSGSRRQSHFHSDDSPLNQQSAQRSYVPHIFARQYYGRRGSSVEHNH